MSDRVKLTVDGVTVEVPPGTLVVDAAKVVENDIPVFCYHPKLKPVGMCRMCLVEIGRPVRDRATGEIVENADGSPQVIFRGLETACTIPVAEGMVVRTTTQVVDAARQDIIEFILTSHPLDCPICDKGGECPLQNLTMDHGPGQSRFLFDDKLKLAKNVPLGELIYLDRERCIQCGRCVRFQEELVDDPVIAFHNRGRSLEIVTLSEPGFDSIWSGNTTDICPVGALTTADFRFGARPWELTPSASICPHCPVGCNTTMSTRREAASGGRPVIKRIMPRQNESVNEIWICDKGRFVHHFADAPDRLRTPLVRQGDRLVEASWDDALRRVTEGLQQYRPSVAGLASDRLSNEDLFLFQKLIRRGLGSQNLDLARPVMGGGEAVAAVGLASGSNLGELGPGDAILVVASDLHETAPVWWLRIKQAAERGAFLVSLNARPTRLDRYANHALRYEPGAALAAAQQLLNLAKIEGPGEGELGQAAEQLIQARNLVVFYGYEGLSYAESETLARLLANLLLLKGPDSSGHAGRRNNGLVPVWPHNNTQGAWDMGLPAGMAPGYAAADDGLDQTGILTGVAEGRLDALYLLGADPVGDGLLSGRGGLQFLVVQELFLTATAQLADVVLPAQSWAEREGTYTNGERRVQRFYPAVPPVGQSRPDWQILALLGEQLGLGRAPFAAGSVFKEIAATVAPYADMSYRSLAAVQPQWPIVGREDLYYGGTSYDNKAGLGQVWASWAENETRPTYTVTVDPVQSPAGLRLVHIPALYASGTLADYSPVIAPRLVWPSLTLNPDDALALGLSDGAPVLVELESGPAEATAFVDARTPAGLGLLQGTSFQPGTFAAAVQKLEPVAAPGD